MCIPQSHGSMMELYIKQIRESVPEAALYEQLAEECTELAQACLKKARKLRGESYTPRTMEEIDASIEEEYTDVRLCANACNLVVDWTAKYDKTIRWINRNGKYKNLC